MSSTTIVNTASPTTATHWSASTITGLLLALVVITSLIVLGFWGSGLVNKPDPTKDDINVYYIFSMVMLGIILIVTFISFGYSFYLSRNSSLGKCKQELEEVTKKFTELTEKVKNEKLISSAIASLSSSISK
jgi:hypothetical protein